VDEGLSGVEIVHRIQQHYSENPLSRTQVSCSIKEVKLGRTDLSNIPPPGREPDELLADCIAEAHAADHHISARKIAQALNISLDSVRHHLTVSLGMTCYHMS
jgi:DNA-binding transcriptional ArsR family regulator